MKTLVEIFIIIENLTKVHEETMKETMWHVTTSIGATGIEITFFIETKRETKSLRNQIKNELGEPNETKLWESTEYDDYVTYKYKFENE